MCTPDVWTPGIHRGKNFRAPSKTFVNLTDRRRLFAKSEL
jgi:hypothetical protein